MDFIGKTIFKKYLISELLRKGSFGSIFLGKNIKNKQTVAIKCEVCKEGFSSLKHEVTILKYLYDNKNRHIPTVYWFGKLEEHLFFVMPYYECSLYDYIKCKKISKVKLKSIIIQCIMLLKSVHELFLVHRDIKPQNIMVHNGELFLIDFGFSIFYIDENKHHFIDNQQEDTLTGSPRFASYYLYEGYKPSRRDDLISISYILLFIYYGELPWDNINLFKNQETSLHIYHEKNINIKNLKSLTNLQTYCEDIHTYMYTFFKHIYDLSYFQEPSYDFLIDLIKKI